MFFPIRFCSPTLVAILLAVFFAASGVRAQSMHNAPGRPDTTSYDNLLEEYSAPDWKQTGWFHYPKKRAPDEQLAYARELEARGRFSKACDEYDDLVRAWGYAPEAPVAQMALARLYEERDRKPDAFREYQYALLMFPNAIAYEDTVRRQMALLRAMEGELGTGFLGFGASMDAEDIAKLYGVVARNAPAGEIAPECLFRMGELYAGEHSKRYDLALEPFETITARHPRSVFAPAAAFGAARARVLLSRKYPRDEKRTRAALQSIDAVLAGFAQRLPDPDEAVRTLQAWREEVSGRLSHAVFQQAEFYDTIRRKPEAAISAYRRFLELHPDAPDAEKARRRLAELESSSPSPNLSPSTAP